jgi:hypothetical protein
VFAQTRLPVSEEMLLSSEKLAQTNANTTAVAEPIAAARRPSSKNRHMMSVAPPAAGNTSCSNASIVFLRGGSGMADPIILRAAIVWNALIAERGMRAFPHARYFLDVTVMLIVTGLSICPFP